jgi:peptidoglycan/xylan/chitin deacetylase (PgdA/CDA1 family)
LSVVFRLLPLGLAAATLALLPAPAHAGPYLYRDCLGLSWTRELPLPPPRRARAPRLGGARTIRGRETSGYVTFTFDDGPNKETTTQILDALDRYDVPATFFVVGRRFVGEKEAAQEGRSVLHDIVRRGHLIGNHTAAHKNLRKLSAKAARDAIESNARALRDELGGAIQLFRPPYGQSTSAVKAFVRKRGDTTVLWSIDPRDFSKRKGMRDSLRRRVVNAIFEKEGGVVLLHDTKSWTAETVPLILRDLEASNCQRIQARQKPIVPVSLHYFLQDKDGSPRPIPPEIQRRTDQYVKNLTFRCRTSD